MSSSQFLDQEKVSRASPQLYVWVKPKSSPRNREQPLGSQFSSASQEFLFPRFHTERPDVVSMFLDEQSKPELEYAIHEKINSFGLKYKFVDV